MQTRIHLSAIALLFMSLFILTGCENYAEKTHESWVTPPSVENFLLSVSNRRLCVVSVTVKLVFI